jgi:hypothetical protein
MRTRIAPGLFFVVLGLGFVLGMVPLLAMKEGKRFEASFLSFIGREKLHPNRGG